MGKAFGITSLVFGIISVGLIGLNTMRSPILGILIPAMMVAAWGIVFGGLAIAKDDSKGLGIAGLILGTIGLAFPIWAFISILGVLLLQPVPIPPP